MKADEEKLNLVRDVWARFTNISTHLTHDANVFITVQQRVFFIFATCATAMGRPIRLEARMRENNDESLSVLVPVGYRYMLFGDESW